ncbi:oligoendopeptidase F [Holzapfeliella sp. He02]|uniref:Oligopeptidase F n=1 Tax=Holzapfeliella saturejae TaxID=3082953 RepID=A0ABU8SGF7_9LACO
MSDASHLPKRQDVPKELTWDLSLVFKTDDDFEQAFKEVEAEIPKIEALEETLISSADNLLNGITEILATWRKLEKVYVYASMNSDVDTNNAKYLAFDAKAGSLAAKVSAATAFLVPTLIQLSDDKLAQFYQDNEELKHYDHFLEEARNEKDHTLDAKQEQLIAAAGDAFGASASTFNVLTNSDMEYPFVEDEDGYMVQLSNGLYSRLLESVHQDVRQGAFAGLYQAYGQFQNTLAQTLSGEVKRHNYLAQTHNYQDAREAALSHTHIPTTVYDTLVEEVNNHLPLLHRYVKLRKKLLDVDELHMYDMYVSLIGEPQLSYDYESAKAEAKKALSVLGEDYLEHVDEIFNNRYIDVVENKGKRSGAYSGGAYDTPPYQLLNWQDNLDNLYTLVHETGHSMHSWYTRHNQPYVYGDYPIFIAEIASTTNENLLTEYLLKQVSDKKTRAFLLNHYLDGFKGTVFRQTQFAEFEHFIHQQDQAGQALTADLLSDYYGELNAHYYGPDVTRDPEIALEWSRIPHFYMNYYVYQYATGFAAASTLSEGIMKQDPQAIENYLNYLKSGSSDYPIETMKKAGVDMTKPDYLKKAFAIFEDRLNELEQLIEEGF